MPNRPHRLFRWLLWLAALPRRLFNRLRPSRAHGPLQASWGDAKSKDREAALDAALRLLEKRGAARLGLPTPPRGRAARRRWLARLALRQREIERKKEKWCRPHAPHSLRGGEDPEC